VVFGFCPIGTGGSFPWAMGMIRKGKCSHGLRLVIRSALGIEWSVGNPFLKIYKLKKSKEII
jgi:hypothetical protein